MCALLAPVCMHSIIICLWTLYFIYFIIRAEYINIALYISGLKHFSGWDVIWQERLSSALKAMTEAACWRMLRCPYSFVLRIVFPLFSNLRLVIWPVDGSKAAVLEVSECCCEVCAWVGSSHPQGRDEIWLNDALMDDLINATQWLILWSDIRSSVSQLLHDILMFCVGTTWGVLMPGWASYVLRRFLKLTGFHINLSH